MRPELLELSVHAEPISEFEIGFTIDICSEIVLSHWADTHREFTSGEFGDHGYNEALSDQNFRTAYQVQYIWQLAIWRISALLDGILAEWFPDLDDVTVRKKLRLLEGRGVVMPRQLKAELHSWLDLRNVLSHRPSKASSMTHQISREDAEEFANVALSVLALAKPYVSPRKT